MTNEEMADMVSLAACSMLGMVVRRSATSVKVQVRWGLQKHREVRAALLEWLDEQGAREVEAAGSVHEEAVSLVERVRAYLDGGAKRQNVIEDGLGLTEGGLDGLLVESNGFSVNAQGWVRAVEGVPHE